MLSDALLSSPVIVGEDGSGAPIPGGFEFGVDPNEDPELALVRDLGTQKSWIVQYCTVFSYSFFEFVCLYLKLSRANFLSIAFSVLALLFNLSALHRACLLD